MKPRLEALSPTDEDRQAWLVAYCRLAGGVASKYAAIVHMYRSADRRDADLMLFAGQYPRACCWGTHVGNAIILRAPCLVGPGNICGTHWVWPPDGVIHACT